MTNMRHDLWLRLWKEEEGQDVIEYALLMVFLALAATAAINALGDELREQFARVAQHL